MMYYSDTQAAIEAAFSGDKVKTAAYVNRIILEMEKEAKEKGYPPSTQIFDIKEAYLEDAQELDNQQASAGEKWNYLLELMTELEVGTGGKPFPDTALWIFYEHQTAINNKLVSAQEAVYSDPAIVEKIKAGRIKKEREENLKNYLYMAGGVALVGGLFLILGRGK